MTREEAIKALRAFGMTKTEAGLRRVHPQGLCNQILDDAAEDDVDGLIALGILKVDPQADAIARCEVCRGTGLIPYRQPWGNFSQPATCYECEGTGLETAE